MTLNTMGTRKLKVTYVGENVFMNTLLTTLIFFSIGKIKASSVVCNQEGKVQKELQGFLEAEERKRDPFFCFSYCQYSP